MGGVINSLVDSSPSKEFAGRSLHVLTRSVQIAPNQATQAVIFAGGCFWGMELAFQRVPGVVHTEVGYTMGITQNPTYEDICTGKTRHVEAVKVTYQESAIPFELLLDFYWDIIDPTSVNKQGADVGDQYRSGIYFTTNKQERAALHSKTQLQLQLGKTVVTEILPAASSTWYRAEEYHQQYLEKGGQCAFTGTTTPIRCYGLSYVPRRFDETSKRILQRGVDSERDAQQAIITVAGGQFWGLELAFQRVPGVISTTVGYAQGSGAPPTYAQVVSGKTDYVQAVQVTFAESALDLETLLDFYWSLIDPTALNYQGDDAGPQFRSGIYHHTDAQRTMAERSRDAQQRNFSSPIATEIAPLGAWIPAEEYLQQYLEKEGQSATKGDVTPIRHYG